MGSGNTKNDLSSFCDALLSLRSPNKQIDKLKEKLANIIRTFLLDLGNGGIWTDFVKPFNDVGLTHAIWIVKYVILSSFLRKFVNPQKSKKSFIYDFIRHKHFEVKCISSHIGFEHVTQEELGYDVYCQIIDKELEFGISDQAYDDLIIDIVEYETGMRCSSYMQLRSNGWKGFTEFYLFKLVNIETQSIVYYPDIISILTKYDFYYGLAETTTEPTFNQRVGFSSILENQSPNETNFKSSQSFYFILDDKDSWVSKPGIFGQADFTGVIGKGAQGVVLEGLWDNQEAAFKFCRVEHEQIQNKEEALNAVNKRLEEMRELKEVQGEHIIQFFGHYR